VKHDKITIREHARPRHRHHAAAESLQRIRELEHREDVAHLNGRQPEIAADARGKRRDARAIEMRDHREAGGQRDDAVACAGGDGHLVSEGLRPSDAPTRSLARSFVGALPPPLRLRRDVQPVVISATA
jgi:hypothetical protein